MPAVKAGADEAVSGAEEVAIGAFANTVAALPGFEGLLDDAVVKGETNSALSGFAPVVAGGDMVLKPVATIRHVAIEPVNPSEPLGIIFKQNPRTGE
jgi:hypothetical protein